MFLQAAEDMKLTAALLLDQSAAYDLLDHPILLRKLAAYNFDESSIKWFQSYLGNRSQSVQVETKQSQSQDLQDHAAPQGSILGGLLFLINENDFPACRVEGESVLFVDDDTDCVSDSDPGKLIEKIELEAGRSCDWLKDNRMCVAGDKSKLLIVGTKELRKKKLGDAVQTVLVDNQVVTETASEKLLGVMLNNQLTWKEHLSGESWRPAGENNSGLISQLAQRVGVLKKLSAVASRKRLRMITSGIFYSKISYCLPLFINTWGLDTYKEGLTRTSSFTKEDLRKLQVLQNKVAKLLIGYRYNKEKKNISTEELLEKSGDLSIHQLGALQTVIMTKKIVLSQKPTYLATRLQINQDGGPRSTSAINPMKLRLSISREGFVHRGTRLFNMLPLHMRQEPHIKKFKMMTKKWIKDTIPIKP